MNGFYIKIPPILQNKILILFDFHCFICNKAVNFLVEKDSRDIFRFVPLQSDLGRKICKYLKINHKKMDTMVLYDPKKNKYWTKAFAVVQILNLLQYSVISNFISLFPNILTNFLYNIIAKHRKLTNFFLTKNNCNYNPLIQKKIWNH